MITTRFYLDTRAVSGDEPAPVKIQINRRSQTALFTTGVRVKPSQWDARTHTIIKHELRSSLNTYLLRMKLQVDKIVQDLVLSGRAADMTLVEIKGEIVEYFNGTSCAVVFGDFAQKYIREKKNERTIQAITYGVNNVYRYDGKARDRKLSSFTASWAQSFDEWLTGHLSPGTRRQIVGNVKSIFARAVKDGIINRNPFADIKTPYVDTRKRDMKIDAFRKLWYYETDKEGEAFALDIFKISFLAIGMNAADIFTLTDRNIFNGRIEYDRAKTGRHYSIEIVDELAPLLEKYHSKGRYFANVSNYDEVMRIRSNMTDKLRKMCDALGIPHISLYWARHSWATYAQELDIPVDVISNALGHSHGTRVTMTYINFNQRKVDLANRAVINYALYGKK